MRILSLALSSIIAALFCREVPKDPNSRQQGVGGGYRLFGCDARLLGGLCFFSLTLSSLAQAGSGKVEGTTIVEIASRDNDNSPDAAVMVKTLKDITTNGNLANCTRKSLNQFIITPQAPGGPAIIATLLTAAAQRLTVSIYGQGRCDFQDDGIEAIRSVVLSTQQ